jgi:hypothetical protein
VIGLGFPQATTRRQKIAGLIAACALLGLLAMVIIKAIFFGPS